MKRRQVWIATELRSTQVVLERVFRRAGFEALTLSGSGPLVARLQSVTPDLLILDGAILDTAGPELAERLERALPPPAVITIADAWDARAPGAAERHGAVRVQRPVRPPEVLRAAGWLLERRQAKAAGTTTGPSPDAADITLCGLGPAAATVAGELQAAGYTVRLLPENPAAREAVSLEASGLLLVDLQSPGAEATLAALKGLPRPPAVVTVGRVDWAKAPHLRLLERLVFLERPVQLSQVLAAVQQILGTREARGNPCSQAVDAGA